MGHGRQQSVAKAKAVRTCEEGAACAALGSEGSPLGKNNVQDYPGMPKFNFIVPVVKPKAEVPVIEVAFCGKSAETES